MTKKKMKRRPAADYAFVTRAMLSGPHADEEVEAMAETFIAGATSADAMGEDTRDEFTTEEIGGPFRVFTVRFVRALGAGEVHPYSSDRMRPRFIDPLTLLYEVHDK